MRIINLLLFVFFFTAFKSMGQTSKLEQSLSASACKHLDNINLDTVISLQEKRNAISLIFAKATKDNEQALKNDKRFSGLKTYEQGRQIGLWISQTVVPMMMNDCPKFAVLMAK